MPTLLLIDDEPAIQHAIRKAFHPPDYQTLTARTAAEGLERLAADRPDVVLLDVHLPDADNLQAFDRVKAADARVPVVLITGHGTTDLAIEAMKRGAFEYLLKPLRYDRLKEVIDRAIASSRLMTVPALVADGESVPDKADALVGRAPSRTSPRSWCGWRTRTRRGATPESAAGSRASATKSPATASRRSS